MKLRKVLAGPLVRREGTPTFLGAPTLDEAFRGP